eukprot:3651625-Alexandrium_andersonii.AAC.1
MATSTTARSHSRSQGHYTGSAFHSSAVSPERFACEASANATMRRWVNKCACVCIYGWMGNGLLDCWTPGC